MAERSPDHILQSGLGQVHGAFLSGIYSEHVNLQVADVHAFHGDQDLLRGKGGDRSQRYFCCCGHALHGKEVRIMPAGVHVCGWSTDTDAVLTTRELMMIKAYGIDFPHLADEEFDHPLGYSTGAADIFGTTGGVLEAALRTVVEMATGKELVDIEFKQVRGWTVAGSESGCWDNPQGCGTNGLHNARVLLDRIKAGETFHMIEIMACPGVRWWRWPAIRTRAKVSSTLTSPEARGCSCMPLTRTRNCGSRIKPARARALQDYLGEVGDIRPMNCCIPTIKSAHRGEFDSGKTPRRRRDERTEYD